MQTRVGVHLARVVEQPDVGEDERVDTEADRRIDGAPPFVDPTACA